MCKFVYPFTAIVGQEKMKKSIVLNIINPSIGGVLIRGEKGTAKSTAVRSLVNLLPEREVYQSCRFNCSPRSKSLCSECSNNNDKEMTRKKMTVVDLPIGATEDRVVGTLDIEHAIKYGEKKFEPGILASANRNLLYVDEINLLDDHIVDILLDAAAMGENIIEREGVSYTHPSRFVLIGTMNPEEGDLRPQLLDRFGLTVDVKGEVALDNRVEVIKRRLMFDENKEGFASRYEEKNQALACRIEEAQKLLSQVEVEDDLIVLTAHIALSLGVDGHRADITMLKTAKTLAAYNGRNHVIRDDIFEAAELVLPHRMRRNPFDESGLNVEVLKDFMNGVEDA
ncbi:magnesium chelatase ATPase subunit I [Acidaminobacter sp. JC074]|uniref:ATP-binding protein n=1 Tax=Acidaminobacter sp. JC074 TaxID=2530199 RepID=UPI001F0FFDCD|nr:AAA family ATPase [Acidaminobacter sp. JC074]MCH4886557.1 magnesium chelatase ATPase subunit I [Acidaminobacter sp. JC074]